ncbi:hypothetical protein [Desulfallas sp. Bu1-1]|uniref:hypothetical protein n=1 Tax=Desulfallas sp. Bu1-1 TaxID=2787620 RepID=UPI0028BD7A46|nr:hypothetical protein [Desulfallas sp. Bu1-1]
MKKYIAVLGLTGLLAGAALGFAGLATAAREDETPGSVNDPLVTKSFVEEYVREYFNQAGSPAGPASRGWALSELEPGEEFTGNAGMELIVRSGRAVVVDPTGSGISDLTDGKNVLAGQVAQNNHLLLIPRADGRGVKAEKPTVIMYR